MGPLSSRPCATDGASAPIGAAAIPPPDRGSVVEPSLTVVCTMAFATVFVVLAVLAALLHLITFLFPPPAVAADEAVVAAIAGTVASAMPGSRVTRIEEEP
jgi:hypothetical protein